MARHEAGSVCGVAFADGRSEGMGGMSQMTATGAEGARVELLDDRVVITRNGFFSSMRQGGRTEIPLSDVSQVLVTTPHLGLRGVFVVAAPGEVINGGFASNNVNPKAVYFDARDQPSFERLRSAILERLAPPPAPRQEVSRWSTDQPVVLVLTARPIEPGVGDLDVDLEERVILEQLQNAAGSDRVDVQLRPASTADTLVNDLLRARATVLHFSGHGTVEGIIVETPDRRAKLVSEASLIRLLTIPEVSAELRVVVLNACLSGEQATAISRIAPCVVGTLDSVQDASAVAFARGFYAALGHGVSVASAFAAGVAQVSLATGETEADMYALFRRTDIDPSSFGILE